MWLLFEILEQEPDIQVIVVPVCGGGLIIGLAVAAKAIRHVITLIEKHQSMDTESMF